VINWNIVIVCVTVLFSVAMVTGTWQKIQKEKDNLHRELRS
jgi:hypothetical protein